jgi:hypothetical protein
MMKPSSAELPPLPPMEDASWAWDNCLMVCDDWDAAVMMHDRLLFAFKKAASDRISSPAKRLRGKRSA